MPFSGNTYYIHDVLFQMYDADLVNYDVYRQGCRYQTNAQGIVWILGDAADKGKVFDCTFNGGACGIVAIGDHEHYRGNLFTGLGEIWNAGGTSVIGRNTNLWSKSDTGHYPGLSMAGESPVRFAYGYEIAQGADILDDAAGDVRIYDNHFFHGGVGLLFGSQRALYYGLEVIYDNLFEDITRPFVAVSSNPQIAVLRDNFLTGGFQPTIYSLNDSSFPAVISGVSSPAISAIRQQSLFQVGGSFWVANFAGNTLLDYLDNNGNYTASGAVAADTVSAGAISADTVSAANISASTISTTNSSGVIAIANISAGAVSAGTVSAANISASTISTTNSSGVIAITNISADTVFATAFIGSSSNSSFVILCITNIVPVFDTNILIVAGAADGDLNGDYTWSPADGDYVNGDYIVKFEDTEISGPFWGMGRAPLSNPDYSSTYFTSASGDPPNPILDLENVTWQSWGDQPPTTHFYVTGYITNIYPGVTISNGVVSATTFAGSGSGLTNIPATGISGIAVTTNLLTAASNTLAAAILAITNGLPTTAITNGIAYVVPPGPIYWDGSIGTQTVQISQNATYFYSNVVSVNQTINISNDVAGGWASVAGAASASAAPTVTLSFGTATTNWLTGIWSGWSMGKIDRLSVDCLSISPTNLYLGYKEQP
jgi:hypothetical protein